MSKVNNDNLLAQWEAVKQNMTMKEFAKSLGISYKSLDNKLHRARKSRKDAEYQINNPIKDEIDGNYRYLLANTTRIKTVDDLLKACQVDLDEWQLDDKCEIGSWEMGRRAEQKKLTWDEGKVTGQVEDTGKLWIETLYRIRATLVRRNPIPITPLVKPVRFALQERKMASAKHTTGKALIVPDSQMGFRRDFRTGELIPFHDRRAHDIILQIASGGDFDAVVYLGDGLDFSEWTDKFVGEPDFFYTTQPAIIEYSWFLSQMRERLPDARQYFILGNHEARPDMMMRKHLFAACQLRPATEIDLSDPYSIDRLLGLQELDIEISENYPNGEVWLGDYVRCIHDDGISSNPGGTAAKLIRNVTSTTLTGHSHRIEYASKIVEDAKGKRWITAATCGCLCHLDYRVPGHKRGQNWRQGFAVVYYDMQSPHVELIPITNGQAIYNGKVYHGGDYVDDLRSATDWKF